jgi:hypothetical protein
VWAPKNWGEVEGAIGVVAESPTLDFKEALGSNRELAKDIAAMALLGGVLIYGIQEDEHALASGITPLELKGLPEKVQQIVDSAISPAPSVGIEAIAKPGAPERGVLIVRVPASTLAPHYAGERFPARSGTTTRYLAEREIESLYERRRVALAAVEELPVLEGHRDPPDAPGGVRGIGVLRIVVAPLAASSHPAGVHLKRPLAAAVEAAEQSLGPLVRSQAPAMLDSLSARWTPRGSVGWQAGQPMSDFAILKETKTAAATCAHELAFSFFATISLVGANDAGFCAYEHLWAAETLVCLSVAGLLFRAVPEASLLRVDLSLQGLDGSVSWALSQGVAFGEEQLRALDSDYRARTRAVAAELADEPIAVARRLLDPFLISFVPEERDTFIGLTSTV